MILVRRYGHTWQKFRAERYITGGGFLILPPELEQEFDKLYPFCLITFEDNTVTGIDDDVAAITNAATATTQGPSVDEDNDAMLIDHEYRLILLELGVGEVTN